MSKLTVTFLVLALLVPAAFAADVSKPAPPKRRMPALPDDVYKAVMAEEAKLNHTLAGCRNAAIPKTCRSEAMTAFGHQFFVIVAKGKGRFNPWWVPSSSGQFDIDCVGETESHTAGLCNGHVEKVPCACANCVSGHQQQQNYSGCFVYICVVNP